MYIVQCTSTTREGSQSRVLYKMENGIRIFYANDSCHLLHAEPIEPSKFCIRWFDYELLRALLLVVFSATWMVNGEVNNQIGLINHWIFYLSLWIWFKGIARKREKTGFCWTRKLAKQNMFNELSTPSTLTSSTIVIWPRKNWEQKNSTHASSFCVSIKFRRV